MEGKAEVAEQKSIILNVLQEFSIAEDRVVMLVQDNEPTNNALGYVLPFEWMGCCDHLLEIVTGVVFDYVSTKEDMAACRAVVTAFTGSSQLQAQLLKHQETATPTKAPLVLIQDVVTRWWSTFAMVERLLALKPFVILLCNQKLSKVALSEAQWEIVELMVVILRPFMKVILSFFWPSLLFIYFILGKPN